LSQEIEPMNENHEIIYDQKEYDNFINKIKTYLNKIHAQYTQIESIILFGSYATKSYNANSDLDLCFLFKFNTNRSLEIDIHDEILNLSKEIDLIIECIYIYPEKMNTWDKTLLENILSEGTLICGSKKYRKIFQDELDLHLYQIIKFSLKNLNSSEKMKFNRMLYGYKTSKEHLGKVYQYKRKGYISELNGLKLGRGSILISNSNFNLIKEQFNKFNVFYSSIPVWIQQF